jgi:hypothetical protein
MDYTGWMMGGHEMVIGFQFPSSLWCLAQFLFSLQLLTTGQHEAAPTSAPVGRSVHWMVCDFSSSYFTTV